MMENAGKPFYLASAGDNQVISTGPAILLGILFGADVGSAVVEISDSKTDGDEDIKFRFAGSTLASSIGMMTGINATFKKGITVDLTNQTHVTLVWRPMAS